MENVAVHTINDFPSGHDDSSHVGGVGDHGDDLSEDEVVGDFKVADAGHQVAQRGKVVLVPDDDRRIWVPAPAHSVQKKGIGDLQWLP